MSVRNNMQKKDNRYLFFMVLTIIGSVIALASDIIIGYAAPGAVGKFGMVQSGWSEVSIWRPTLSLIMASVALPLYLPGLFAVSKRVEATAPKTGKTFRITLFAASTGGLLIHAVFCIPQFAYKYLCDAGYPDLAVKLTDKMLEMAIPSILFSSVMMLVAFVILNVAILRKKTIYSRWCVLLTPLIIAPATALVEYLFSDSAFFSAFGMCKMNLGMLLFFIAAALYEHKRQKTSILFYANMLKK